MEGKLGTVCVTGGAGYIGSWLIIRLLERGYSVNATVRLDSESKKDISHLTNLPGASERLKIFNADLYKPETFSAPIEGCDGVFHVAHPLNFEGKEADDSMINMAVEGTLGILKACLNSKTVKKVVLTSSIAAVVFNNSGLEEFNENSWTDVELCRSTKVAGSSYSIPKTLAEQTALNFGEEHGLDVVAINPSVVVGPFICPHFPASNYIALSLYMGNRDGYKYLTRAQFVHIDDVVSGHLYLFESPNAKGRYICSSVNTTFDQLVKFHSDRYPEIEMPLDFFKGMDINPFCFSSKKLLDLGFKFKYSLEEMYDGAIQSCYEKGFL